MTKIDIHGAIAYLDDAMSAGMTLHAALGEMHRRGHPVGQVILAVGRVCGLTFAEARETVLSDPAWIAMREHADALQVLFDEAIDSMGVRDSDGSVVVDLGRPGIEDPDEV